MSAETETTSWIEHNQNRDAKFDADRQEKQTYSLRGNLDKDTVLYTYEKGDERTGVDDEGWATASQEGKGDLFRGAKKLGLGNHR